MTFDNLPDNEDNKPIAIRLNRKNPREARALDVLARYGDNRRAITDALICLDEKDQRLEELAAMQRLSLSILQKIESGAVSFSSGQQDTSEANTLSDDFKAGLKKLARPVVRLEDSEE